MAGLYIHIPFCKSRCLYCGFYSTTRRELRQRYVDALCQEMEMRAERREARTEIREVRVESQEARTERIETIYLGGGTPSQLSSLQLHQLFNNIYKVYTVASDAEVTMECNPDDLTAEYVAMLSQLPVNRVSMGAQTFSDQRLQFLHRRHTARQTAEAVDRLRNIGIRNISVDLMYGFPNETIDEWCYDISQALALQVEHLSAYGLMYEEGTPLFRMLQEGRVSEVDEELSRQMYYELKDRLELAGFEHYEISNFARRGRVGDGGSFRSRHNSSYWNQTPYIGLGAAAHSYNGQNRQWNPADIAQYIAAIERGEPCYEYEELNEHTRYNELVMTRLRTCDGLPLSLLSTTQLSYCMKGARPFLSDGLLTLSDDTLRFSRRGLYVSDMVMCELMMV